MGTQPWGRDAPPNTICPKKPKNTSLSNALVENGAATHARRRNINLLS